jgi:hypothetical protein
MKIKPRIFVIAIIIEIIVFLVISSIVSSVIYNSKMSAGSYLSLAPFVFYKETYSNSVLYEKNFNLIMFILDLIIIIAIALLLSTKLKNGKKNKK